MTEASAVLRLELDDRLAGKGVRTGRIISAEGVLEELRFESSSGPLSVVTGADPFVIALLLPIMKRGKDIWVEGTVSRRCMENVDELQNLWSKWCPDIYTNVTISAKTVAELNAARSGKLAAFSGGVDSYFTAIRHIGSKDQSRNLQAVVFAQGFDIPLNQSAVFEQAVGQAREFLQLAGLQANLVRSNIRDFGVSWEHIHGMAIASCLALYGDSYEVALIGSGKAYDELIFPWGSSPVTDHLFSTDLLEVRHDGAGFSRTEKIAELVRYPEILPNLRVCYQARGGVKNCGKCEKCIRTYFSFCAAGHADPNCFATNPTSWQRRLVIVRSRRQLAELENIEQFARRNRVRGAWLGELQFAIRLNRLLLPLTGRRSFWELARKLRAKFRRNA